MKKQRYRRIMAAALALALSGCAAAQQPFAAVADTASDLYSALSSTAVRNQAPITLRLWHGFTGREAAALETLTETFNQTMGEQQRISVQLTGYDGIQGVNDAIKDALQQEKEKTDDLVRLPDLFFAWDDTAYRLDQLNLAMHLDEFLSSEQQEAFLECVQAEMYPGDSDSMTLFPIGLDTTILMYRQDLWETFSSTLVSEDAQEQQPELTEEPADLERPAESLLSTWEGIGETALKYRQWYQTQQQTEQEEESEPRQNTPGSLAADQTLPSFFVTDCWGQLLLSGYRSLGQEMFTTDQQTVRFDFARERVRVFWDFWYPSAIQGCFSWQDSLAAVSQEDVMSCLLPTSQLRNVNTQPYFAMLSTPYFAQGEAAALQQTLGLVAIKGSQEHQAAIQIFLTYLLEPDRMAQMAVACGMLPTLRESLSDPILTQAFESTQIGQLEQAGLLQAVQQLETHTLFPLSVFEGSEKLTDMMDQTLANEGRTSRNRYLTVVKGGMDSDEALDIMTSDSQFENWYLRFRDAVVEAALLGES